MFEQRFVGISVVYPQDKETAARQFGEREDLVYKGVR
jgi:hypothetical protein